jgi:hypothetical protein
MILYRKCGLIFTHAYSKYKLCIFTLKPINMVNIVHEIVLTITSLRFINKNV